MNVYHFVNSLNKGTPISYEAWRLLGKFPRFEHIPLFGGLLDCYGWKFTACYHKGVHLATVFPNSDYVKDEITAEQAAIYLNDRITHEDDAVESLLNDHEAWNVFRNAFSIHMKISVLFCRDLGPICAASAFTGSIPPQITTPSKYEWR